MDAIVALCKRRGFVFQSSEIYGGFSGLWDYGPLGVELKRNIKETWWRDMITTHDELDQPEGAPRRFQMVGIESSVIMHPRVWKTSAITICFMMRWWIAGRPISVTGTIM